MGNQYSTQQKTTQIVASLAVTAIVFAWSRKTYRRWKSTRIAYTDATILIKKLRNGEISSEELLELYIERIERIDHLYNAVVVRDFETARKQAKKCDEMRQKGMILGPLHGLPMTVKEELEVSGFPLSCRGDPKYQEINNQRIQTKSSEVIQRVLEAGAIIFAKTNIPKGCLDWQCYNQVFGVTCNPYNEKFSPGGSSGGSAVALICGFTPLELGGDSAGSIRIPSAFNGCFGLAPTHGLVPTDRPWFKAVVYGPMARNARDCELLLSVMGSQVLPAYPIKSSPYPPFRVETEQNFTSLSASSSLKWEDLRCAVWDGTSNYMNEKDFKVSREVQLAVIHLSTLLRHVRVSITDLYDVNTKRIKIKAKKQRGEDEEGENCSLVPLSESSIKKSYTLFHQLLSLTEEVVTAKGNNDKDKDVMSNFLKAQQNIMNEWDSFFDSYDFLILPVTVTTPFKNDHNYHMDAYSDHRICRDVDDHCLEEEEEEKGHVRDYKSHFFWSHFSILGQLPSISLPMGLTDKGLPKAVQIVCKRNQDMKLLHIANMIEKRFTFTVNTPRPVGL